jgi:hypothetical protein
MVKFGLTLAAGAEAKDGEVVEGWAEAVVVPYGLLQGAEVGRVQLQGLAAAGADQVVVLPVLCPVVLLFPFPQVGLGYQPQASQEVQGAVDSGDVDVGIAGPDLGEDIFGAEVGVPLLQDLEDEEALGGNSQPQAAEGQGSPFFRLFQGLLPGAEGEGNGAIVVNLYYHVLPEAAGLHFEAPGGEGPEELLKEGAGLLGGGGPIKAGPPPLPGVGQEGELAYRQNLGPRFQGGEVEFPIPLGEEAEVGCLLRQAAGVLGGIVPGHPHKDHQPPADFACHLRAHPDRGPAYPLHHCPQTTYP